MEQPTLAPLLSKYSADDVYNLDKAALFYNMLRIKMFAVKGTVVKGQKQGKERITVLFGASISGKHKLPLLVGKRGKSRCFKYTRLPPKQELVYRHDKKTCVAQYLKSMFGSLIASLWPQARMTSLLIIA